MKIDAKQIPKEAAAAAIKARAQELSIEEVLAAALSAWPGAGIVATEDHSGRYPQIILPLPKERE